MRIICVDDENLILDFTVSMCRNLPQKPDVIGFVKSGEALKWLQQNQVDIALLDINMPEMDGITLAARIKEIHPNIAIIFLTGYSEYAVDAFSLRVSGYLMKPINTERLAAEINYAIRTIQLNRKYRENARVVVRTFGNFDVFADGKIIRFSRSRAKELLAFLVDRRGSLVTRAYAFSVLWEDQPYDRSMQKQFDVVLRSLRTTLEENGVSDVLEISKGNIRVVPERLDCDLYRFYDGDIDVINSYHGEYMSEYSWAVFTEATISARKPS